MGYIYIAHNMISDKAYIGQTVQPLEMRLKAHRYESKLKKYNSYFHSAILKYGWDSFEITYVEFPDEDLDDAETMFIRDYRDVGIELYNLTDGDEQGRFRKGQIPWIKGRHPRAWNKGIKWPEMFGEKHPRAKVIILIHPDGKEERFGCMRDACRKYNLLPSKLTLVAQGKRKHTNGYRCRYQGTSTSTSIFE